MDKKYFTAAEATKMLPLVRKIVEDILASGRELQDLRSRLGEKVQEDPDFQNRIGEMEKYFSELKDLGCEFKDWNFQIGLVDFPAMIGGEEVMLCWRSDEDELKFYHGIHEGYIGRKIIPEEYFSER